MADFAALLAAAKNSLGCHMALGGVLAFGERNGYPYPTEMESRKMIDPKGQ